MITFLTCKLHWQAKEKFPVHLFKWKGIDGSEVLSHIPLLYDFYTGNPVPTEIKYAWDNFAQKEITDELMFPFGYGDGGGGANMDELEYTMRMKDYPGLPKVNMDTGESLF